MRSYSDQRRIGRGALLAIASVVLPASLGIAAGTARHGSRGALDGALPSDAPAPRETIDRSEGDGSCVPAAGESMLLVPAGVYRSFFKRDGKPVETNVAPFHLDELPVPRGAFAGFVRKNPAWRRSRVKRLFAEEAYLSDFHSDGDAGGDASTPVTYVSWFAARAYCACQGKRLPTLAEWERAANPDGDAPRASSRTTGGRLAFAMGGAPRASGSPSFGFVWEWTEDFDGAPVSGRTSDASASNLFCGAGVRAADAGDYGGFLRFSFRSSLRAAYTLKNLGFRCARDAR
jgi:formylglycine-generating enzyme required for sulfatase activity